MKKGPNKKSVGQIGRGRVGICRYLGLELQVQLRVELLAPPVSWKPQELEEDEKCQVKMMPAVSVNKRSACA